MDKRGYLWLQSTYQVQRGVLSYYYITNYDSEWWMVFEGWGKGRVPKMRMLRWMHSQQPHKTGTKFGMIVHKISI